MLFAYWKNKEKDRQIRKSAGLFYAPTSTAWLAKQNSHRMGVRIMLIILNVRYPFRLFFMEETREITDKTG